ncbi:MAG: isoleucine--tRNA ligase [archaeon]
MYDPQETEKEILEFWDENNIFEKRRDKNKGSEKWSFIDGPITANFKMGIHHAAGRSYKDLYIRWRAMQGYDQRYQNGFDTQGLPVEQQAEKELEINSKKEIEEMGIEKFTDKCKEIIKKYSKSQTSDSVKLGQWMDWDNSYYTYKDDYIEHVWNFMKECNEKNLLEEGTKVLWWCPRCGTSLSQKEITEGYVELEDESIFFKLPLKEEEAYLMVWTTTPWTLSANVACAVNPDEIYAKVEQDGEYYYMAKDAVHTTMKGEYEIKEELRGEKLLGKHYKPPHPELPVQKEPEHKIISWDEVGTKEGTGIVHIAPGCGEEDEELGEEHGLKNPSPMNEDGTYKEGYGWLTGKYVNENVNEEVIKDLEERNVLYKSQKYKHQYPLCWRCDEKLIQRKAEGEWFIDQTKIKKELEREASKVRWEPEFLEKEYQDWLENMGKWIISRKRYWGTPLPIWKCDECGESTIIGSRKELEEKAVEGIDQLKELHKPWIDKVKIKCPKCGEKKSRIKEVADCWMDSGLVPYATLNYMKNKEYFEEWFPADFITEMREQVNKWFHTTMVASVVLEEKTPYLNVMTYSEVIDDEGKQMSKSKGNAIWADEAAEKIGMDNIRWTFIKGNPRTKTSLGYDSGEEAERELKTLFNINQYIKETVGERKKLEEKDLEKLKKEDKWILSKLNTIKKEVKEHLKGLEPHKSARKIREFFLEDLSRGYIQYTRGRAKKKEEKELIGKVMDHALLETLKLMAPYTPFLTEKIYQENYRGREQEESIHLFKWPEPREERINESLERRMKIAQEVNETIRALRSGIGRGIRWPVKKIVVETKQEEVEEAVNELEEIIKKQTNVREIEIKKEMPEVEKETTLNQKAVGAEFQADAVKIMKKIKGKLDELREEIEKQGFYRLDIGTKEVKIKGKHIITNRKMPENLEARVFSKGEIYIDKEINEDIEKEGIAREVMRHTQQMRKKAGLEKKQDIELHVKTDQDTAGKLEEWEERIQRRTGAEKIDIDSERQEKEYEANKKVKIKDREIEISFNVMN